jgi:hypothetical protein
MHVTGDRATILWNFPFGVTMLLARPKWGNSLIAGHAG